MKRRNSYVEEVAVRPTPTPVDCQGRGAASTAAPRPRESASVRVAVFDAALVDDLAVRDDPRGDCRCRTLVALVEPVSEPLEQRRPDHAEPRDLLVGVRCASVLSTA